MSDEERPGLFDPPLPLWLKILASVGVAMVVGGVVVIYLWQAGVIP